MRDIGLRQKKREHLLQRILDTTCELIDEVGYERTQVEEIARRLDISKPTFYRYFASKDDVLAEVQLRMTETWAAQVDAELADARGRKTKTAEKLQALARFAARDLLGSEAISRAVYLHTGTVSSDRVRVAEKRAERSLTRLLSEGQVLGDIDCRYPADLLSLIVEAVFVTVGYAWAIEEIDSRELEAALLLALQACLNGFHQRDTG